MSKRLFFFQIYKESALTNSLISKEHYDSLIPFKNKLFNLYRMDGLCTKFNHKGHYRSGVLPAKDAPPFLLELAIL